MSIPTPTDPANDPGGDPDVEPGKTPEPNNDPAHSQSETDDSQTGERDLSDEGPSTDDATEE